MLNVSRKKKIELHQKDTDWFVFSIKTAVIIEHLSNLKDSSDFHNSNEENNFCSIETEKVVGNSKLKCLKRFG